MDAGSSALAAATFPFASYSASACRTRRGSVVGSDPWRAAPPPAPRSPRRGGAASPSSAALSNGVRARVSACSRSPLRAATFARTVRQAMCDVTSSAERHTLRDLRQLARPRRYASCCVHGLCEVRGDRREIPLLAEPLERLVRAAPEALRGARSPRPASPPDPSTRRASAASASSPRSSRIALLRDC